MTPTIYMVIGCPGSGKSWVCEQLRELYTYVRHDDYKDIKNYVRAIMQRAATETKALLIETPFSVSQVKDPLEKNGLRVVPVFILEQSEIIRQRYRNREGKAIPEGHITRQATYAERALAWQAFSGTSAKVLEHLIMGAMPRHKFPWE